MEALKERVQKLVVQAEKERQEKLANLLAMGLLPEKLGDRCKYYCKYLKGDYATFEEVETFEAFFAFISGVELLPLATWKNGCTHIEPRQNASEEIREEAPAEYDYQEIAPIVLRSQCSFSHERPVDTQAEFYIKNAEGHTVHCHVVIKKTGRSISAVKKYGKGYTHVVRTDFSGHCGNVIRWSAGGPEYPNSFTEYGYSDQALEDFLNDNCRGRA